MFGGLSVKGAPAAKASKPPAPTASAGSAINGDDEKKVESPAAAAASSSAFSFMSSSPTPAPEPAATPAASAFSFMSSSAAPSAPATEESQAPVVAKEDDAATSGFSFLAQPAAVPEEEPAAEAPAPTSAFGFMSTTSESTPKLESPPPSPAPATAAGAGASGFSFMSSISPTTADASANPPPPASEVTKSSSTGSAMSALTSPDIVGATPSSSTTTTAQPVGSGVTFGGAAAAIKKKKPIKKRVRGTRVGTATAAGASSLPPPLPTTKTEIEQQQQQQSLEQDDPRQASLEAARRAEEFMNEKMKASHDKLRASQQAAADSNRDPSPAPPQPSYQPAETPPTYTPVVPPAVTPVSPKGDDDYDAAKAAAEEAKRAAATSNQKKPAGFRMGFGGLFNKNKKQGGGPIMSTSNKSIPAIPSELSSTPTAAAVGGASPIYRNTTTTDEEATENNEDGSSSPRAETAAERIQREQEEINRAMAKRQLAMQQPVFDNAGTTKPAESGGFQPPSFTAPTTTPSFTPAVAKPKPKPTPPPPREPTPEERLDVILKLFNSDAHAAMERVAKLREQRARLLEEKAAAKTMQLMASQQIAQAEAQQAAAAELEDFDLADRLGAVIDTHQMEKREQTTLLMNIGKALEHLDDQRDAVVGAVAKCFGEVHTKLETFANEQDRKDRKDDTDSMQKFSIVAKQLSAENERLIKDLKHVERDEELLAEEKNEVETAIGEQTEGMEQAKEEANKKLHVVQEEIVELQRRLREKEQTAAELKADVYQAETAISKVRSSFSRQLGRVQNKEAAIKEHRKEWKIEHERYEKEKTVHDKQVEAHSESLLKHEKLIARLNTEMKHAEAFKTIVEAGETVVYECAAAGDIGVFQEDGERQELAILHKQVVAGEAALLEANHILKAADAALVSLKQEQEELQSRIPELESEKKQAAARRDFKTAGKASKEIKDLTARLHECEEDLDGDAAERVKKARGSLETIQQELDTKKTILGEKEKEQGINAMRDLAGTIKRLMDTKHRVCNEVSGNNVQAIGASVLEGQISALRKEGDSYDAKYGGWEAIWNEIVGQGSFDRSAQSMKQKNKKQAAKSDKEKPTEAEAEDDAESDSSEDKIAKFRALTKHLKEAEDSLEAAVAIEDYEKAAELDEVFNQLSADLLALALTDEEMEIAMSEEDTNQDDEAADVDMKDEEKSPETITEEQPAEEKEDEEESEAATAEADAAKDETDGQDGTPEAISNVNMDGEASADGEDEGGDVPPALEDVESADDIVQDEADGDPVGDESESSEGAESSEEVSADAEQTGGDETDAGSVDEREEASEDTDGEEDEEVEAVEASDNDDGGSDDDPPAAKQDESDEKE